MRNRKLKDYTGERYGRLIVLSLVERDSRWNDHLMEVRCDCGVVTRKRLKSIRSGHTSSCGCLARETLAERNKTHGLSRAHRREYRSWKDMRARCNNPNNADYADYGGRGIAVCDAWDDFAAFYADMGDRPDGFTIDRIDVDGNYEPGNCRWASHKEQANNKRSNHLIEIDGERLTLQAWCDRYGIDSSKVRYRLSVGMPPKEALTSGDLRGRTAPS